jgi:FkbM family methyltransferase
MSTHLLVSIHRWSRSIAQYLGPLRPVASVAFQTLMRLRHPPGTVVSASQNGRQWKLVPEVALRGALQEFDTVEWFRSVVRPGMTALDVGANVGQMTLELAALVGPSGRVLAIEPGRGNLELLQLHLIENGMRDRVEVVEAACADVHGGEIEFFVAGEHAASVGSGHSIAGTDAIRRGAPHSRVHRVCCARVSIDGLCSERDLRPDVIKIDVEGGELHVLRGAQRTLARVRPRVRFGFHPFAFEDPAAASDELRRFFADLGYRIENAPDVGPLALDEYAAVPG